MYKTFKIILFPVISIAIITMIPLLLGSCDSDDNNQNSGYDPGKEVIINGFFPDSGKIAEKVIIEGENFGSDPEKISVYFNNKKGRAVKVSVFMTATMSTAPEIMHTGKTWAIPTAGAWMWKAA